MTGVNCGALIATTWRGLRQGFDSLAAASVCAFALGELVDFAVYSPLQKKHLVLAVIASGVIGGAIDSLIFLQIAFGSTMFWQGQIMAKTFVSLFAGVLIYFVKNRSTVRTYPA